MVRHTFGLLAVLPYPWRSILLTFKLTNLFAIEKLAIAKDSGKVHIIIYYILLIIVVVKVFPTPVTSSATLLLSNDNIHVIYSTQIYTEI